MPTRTQTLNQIATNYLNAAASLADVDVHVAQALVHYGNNADHAAIYQLIMGLYDASLCIGYLTWKQGAYTYGAVPYFLSEHTVAEGAGVTWQSIVEAWIKDDFAGRVPTIAVIDRMRQILWDEPFFVQWAARPERAIPE